MVYLKNLRLPSDEEETGVFMADQRTCYQSIYPFKIFSQKQLDRIDFQDVTLLYGGNGSGKTTLLNVIGELCRVNRLSAFNKSAFFDRYVRLCRLQSEKLPPKCQFLSSDDIFDYIMNTRYINAGIDGYRQQLSSQYAAIKKRVEDDADYRRFHGFDDYDRWKDVYDAGLRKKSESSYINDRLERNIAAFSNGETAMRYFYEYIDQNALYLLDEPENSLSVARQIELTQYLEDAARFYGCQLIIATHSPIFLSIRKALIYDLDSLPVETKNWTELENVRKYYDFFMEHQREFEK